MLVRRGPYRFSRNPQYVGFIVGLIGWVFLSSSRLALPASFAGVIPLIVVPFAEEGWLLARRLVTPTAAQMNRTRRYAVTCVEQSLAEMPTELVYL